ncbi:flagellar hook assembly protein FlgD [Viridibacterium curvum]|uniref:Basal-body rod modification protein FlgD n=1 Tax=Viridibacterium curvum TaxID=1101404 RepID=A0ABP9Q703_9RHOO
MATASSLTTDTNASALYQSLSAKTETKTTSKTDEAQSRFLKLLTTQLKNQDPLNPVDNAQTTSQLAQISTVDGIERLNDTLTTLVGSYRSSETLQAAALVGHAVLVEGNQMKLSEGYNAYGGFEIDKSADRVTISIRDSNGIEVASEQMTNLEAGAHDFAWDGVTSDGSKAANGTYTIKVTATKGTAEVTSTALEFATVTGVNNSTSGITIDAGRFSKLSMSDVRRII